VIISKHTSQVLDLKMRSSLLIIALFFGLVVANQIYVSPQGDDNGDGSKSDPFATIKKALTIAQANDTILIDSGVVSGLNSFCLYFLNWKSFK